MVGGDFNTELQRGWRGDRLRELLLEVHLENSTAESNTTFENLWTFRSCLGEKRILDYCFVPSEIIVQSSSSTNDLHLGSDHRCVQSCILLPSEGYTRRQKKYKKKVDWALYSDEVKKLSHSAVDGGLVHLENQLVDTASGCDAKVLPADTKIWDCQELRDLREKRRLCTNVEERSKITKTIWKVTRQQLRRYRTKQIQARLESFSELQYLECIRVYPIKKQSIMKADDQKRATSLGNVYSTDTPYSYSSACNVPPFTIEELNYVAKKKEKR